VPVHVTSRAIDGDLPAELPDWQFTKWITMTVVTVLSFPIGIFNYALGSFTLLVVVPLLAGASPLASASSIAATPSAGVCRKAFFRLAQFLHLLWWLVCSPAVLVTHIISAVFNVSSVDIVLPWMATRVAPALWHSGGVNGTVTDGDVSSRSTSRPFVLQHEHLLCYVVFFIYVPCFFVATMVMLTSSRRRASIVKINSL